ncbi:MAG: hypothetical protein WC712_06290 [Candidatus Brocadiia bacterium]
MRTCILAAVFLLLILAAVANPDLAVGDEVISGDLQITGERDFSAQKVCVLPGSAISISDGAFLLFIECTVRIGEPEGAPVKISLSGSSVKRLLFVRCSVLISGLEIIGSGGDKEDALESVLFFDHCSVVSQGLYIHDAASRELVTLSETTFSGVKMRIENSAFDKGVSTGGMEGCPAELIAPIFRSVDPLGRPLGGAHFLVSGNVSLIGTDICDQTAYGMSRGGWKLVMANSICSSRIILNWSLIGATRIRASIVVARQLQLCKREMQPVEVVWSVIVISRNDYFAYPQEVQADCFRQNIILFDFKEKDHEREGHLNTAPYMVKLPLAYGLRLHNIVVLLSPNLLALDLTWRDFTRFVWFDIGNDLVLTPRLW